MTGYRAHQASLRDEVGRRVLLPDKRLRILAWVVPGGGKSWLPMIIHRRWPKLKIAWFVPRVSLRQQAAESMKGLGISIWESENDIDPSRGTSGFVASHAGLTAQPDLYIQELERNEYFVVVDELHHAKIARDGQPNQLASILPRLRSRVELFMTGTLETNDESFIYGLKYEEIATGWRVDAENSADVYIRYDRKTALSEDALVPIEFYHHDGPVEFIDSQGHKTRKLSSVEKGERSAAIFTALRTELALQLLDLGLAHWRNHGDRLIIVCDRQQSAKSYQKLLQDRGIEAALAIADEGEEAREAVKRFRRGEVRVMVTCAMCYEGLDCPPVTHIICLTHIRSVPWIEQMLARSWRWSRGKARCYAFVPDDPAMNDVIERIREEEPANVRAPGEGAGGNGAGPSTVAISSNIDATRMAFLDGETALAEARTRATEALSLLGLDSDHPLLAQMVEAQMTRQVGIHPAGNGMTDSERAKQIRKSMADLCRRADRARGAPESFKWGTTGKELYQRVGIIFETATLPELERAAQQATSFCSKYLA